MVGLYKMPEKLLAHVYKIESLLTYNKFNYEIYSNRLCISCIDVCPDQSARDHQIKQLWIKFNSNQSNLWLLQFFSEFLDLELNQLLNRNAEKQDKACIKINQIICFF